MFRKVRESSRTVTLYDSGRSGPATKTRIKAACSLFSLERMRKDCPRISVGIKVDYRKVARGRLESKIASVERRLKRKVRT